jgi:iron(III) transport system permease protein
MSVTDLLSIRTYAEEAFLQYGLGRGPEAAAAVALPPLLVLGGLVVLGTRQLLRAEPARLPTASVRARAWPLGRWRRPVGAGLALVVAAFVGLPLVTLVWRAGRVGGAAALGRPPGWSLAGLAGTLRFAWGDAYEPLGYSLACAAAGATVAVALAWLLAWECRRPGVWRWVTAAAVALGLATPGPVAGMALVYAYRDVPLLYDYPVMIVLAAVLRTLPYGVLVLWPAVRAVPPEFLDAAAVDGLGPVGQAWHVALPLTRTAAAGAWCVAFTLALGELPATNLVYPPGVMPLQVVIWSLLHTGVESHTAGVVLVMLGAVTLAGVAALFALRRVRAL